MFKRILFLLVLLSSLSAIGQVQLLSETKITDIALHFDGSKISGTTSSNSTSSTPYDYKFGPQISAHGDCVATYKHYVFMTWYKGGKGVRNMMLTRYNTQTGTMATIEFPHRHTGYRNQWWIGESHNTIGIGVSPLDGTIHLLFDMHAYGTNRPSDGSLSQDYFRYSYSKKNAADVADTDFTLSQFVEDNPGDYTHLSLNGTVNYSAFSEFTYPKFFKNNRGDLFFSMRKGSSSNGGYHFAKYDANTSSWSNFIKVADRNAKNYGQAYNWGMYGRFQYVGNKIRIGFQRRLGNTSDKYLYQNGFYYAYSDDQSGQTSWKNHKGESFSTPLRDADKILVSEPGDLVQTTQKDKVYMVGGFDWTVTDRGDVHIIGKVKDNQYNVTKNVHTYKPAGATEFITTTDFSGASTLYTYGNNIYIIGLNSAGRVFIEKSEGGTNNFQKIYEATSGTQFRHGVAYISNGKLYYYLMERTSTGDQRPLYLQIIDLDIDQQPFRISLTSPFNGETYVVGQTIQISANAVDENGSVSKVTFLVNGQPLAEDTTAPYAVNWTPTTPGSYTVQAIAYNTTNQTVSSTEISVSFQEKDPTDLTGDVYRLKNVATGKYLMSSGSSVEGRELVEGDDAFKWTFVKTTVSGTEYFNIDSEVNGILRGSGGNYTYPYVIINTPISPPVTDVDKIWTMHYIDSDNTYRFEVKDTGRFLYHQTDDEFYSLPVEVSDTRSKWVLESTTLSASSITKSPYAISIYPNPARDSFTIASKNFQIVKVSIYDILGKAIFGSRTTAETVIVKNDGKFPPGIYFIEVITDNNQTHHSKLIVK